MFPTLVDIDIDADPVQIIVDTALAKCANDYRDCMKIAVIMITRDGNLTDSEIESILDTIMDSFESKAESVIG